MKRFKIEVMNSSLKNVTINTNLVNCLVEGIRIDRSVIGYAPTMSPVNIFLDDVNCKNSEDSIVKIFNDDFSYTLLLSKSSNTEISILTLSEVSKNVYEVTNILRSNNAAHIERHIRNAMSEVELLGSFAGCNVFDEIMKNEVEEVETLTEEVEAVEEIIAAVVTETVTNTEVVLNVEFNNLV